MVLAWSSWRVFALMIVAMCVVISMWYCRERS